MTYKGEKNIKLLVLDTKVDEIYVRINNEVDLEVVIKENLNSVDYDLVQDGAEIDIIEFRQ